MRDLGRRIWEQAGYSLVELMTVLGVVAILFAIAAPTISNHIALQNIRSAGQEVVTVLRETREAAINQGLPRYVHFDPVNETYQVFEYVPSTKKWSARTAVSPLPGGVSFADDDVDFPAMTSIPEAGADPVPSNAAYFDTRGRYPYQGTTVKSYEFVLRGGLGKTITLQLHRRTGQVTGL
jgi:prepilin-type N-terminal cleavage/methylation domain-containing protein